MKILHAYFLFMIFFLIPNIFFLPAVVDLPKLLFLHFSFIPTHFYR